MDGYSQRKREEVDAKNAQALHEWEERQKAALARMHETKARQQYACVCACAIAADGMRAFGRMASTPMR